MSNLDGRYEHDAAALGDEAKRLDKTARLAIEAGPGHGFRKAITDMANADLSSFDETTIGSETVEEPSEAGAIERVGVDDLAFAAREMGVKRLIVVTPFGDATSMATVLTLSRLLTEDSHPVALLQLDGEAPSPAALEEDDTEAGWIDLLGGGRAVGDIIHRDAESRLHVTPSGQIDTEALEEDQLEDLAFYLEAFAEAYAMTVIHAPLAALKRIEGLSAGETAVIVVASEGKAGEVESMATDLNATSNYDVLHLISEADTLILH